MNTTTSFFQGLLSLETFLLPGLVPAVWFLAHDFWIGLFQIIWGG
ncbi:hypothetical protein [Armatimonas sp.]